MNKTILRTISMIMAIALTFGVFAPGQVQSVAAASVTTFVTEADARVSEDKPDVKFGTYGTVLYVEGGIDPDHESYLRFTVTGISGTVISAKLRAYVVDRTSNGPAVYTTSNDWAETGITWNNRPARTSGALDDEGSLETNTWAEFDVTSIVKANGTYSFVLATDSNDGLTLASREGSYPAQLVVTIGDSTGSSGPLPGAAQPTATPLPANTQTNPSPAPTNVPPTTQPTTQPTIPPTTQPTNIVPSPTPTTVAPVASPTSVPPTIAPTQPPATATAQPVISAPPVAGSGMWISPSELMSLPTSGRAWDTMRARAYGTWGTADLKNQDNKHDIYTLSGALVYARTGDTALRNKVRDAIIAAKRTMDESSEWQTRNGVLSAGRQLGAYVIAADLIALKNHDAAADQEFRTWLTAIRTTNIGTHGRMKNITYTCENATHNWATYACASRIAVSIYLGDTADVQRSASIIRALMGERNYYPANAPGRNGYFEHTNSYDASWACNDSLWTGINPACAKSGVNLDGALVEDVSRGGACCTPVGAGISYSWEALQGLYVSAELLYRTGAYGDPYQWSNQALRRSMDFMQRSGWGITSVATYVPWLANRRYGTSYPVVASSNGRIMAWGDWLYQR
jgi:hypothetical protein